MTTTLFTHQHEFNSDIYTPVELYLGLRHSFRKVCLMESNDYYSRQESKSFIGLEPIIELKLTDYTLKIAIEGKETIQELHRELPVSIQVQTILSSFHFKQNDSSMNGFFGRLGFEFALLNEKHIVKEKSTLSIPDVHLFVYKYILVIDHFKDQGLILKNSLDNSPITSEEINHLLIKKPFATFPFEVANDEKAEKSDEGFKLIVEQALEHVKRGDVFQLVVSNAFSQGFFGDDFAVYRALRRLNPSPYLFYFDFEEYHLFGSSPEAQLKIEKGVAEIHPIAGTMVKTGDPVIDNANIAKLISDEKENAEHTMLVDLARNDLSRSCDTVKVHSYKQIQAFSHVYHIVSVVKGQLHNEHTTFETFSHSFPAGTLSGTPKPKALELIAKYEKSTRDFYGGAIGLLAANGDVNMAIVIRSVLSKDGRLHYRAGAGVVHDSIPQNECDEVHNKLKAVRSAIRTASLKNEPKMQLL